MFVLEAPHVQKAKSVYDSGKYHFPLIGAVLNGSQEGTVFGDSKENSEVFFVIHKFGYSQLYGRISESFLTHLRNFLFIERAFSVPKIRTYAPENADIFLGNAEKSQRCQFRLQDHSPTSLPEDVTVSPVTTENADYIDSKFNLALFDRFWNSRTDFLNFSKARVLSYKGEVASLCYAAAVYNNIAEIDVATLPQFRKMNLGKIVCSEFIQGCYRSGLTPNWDCFTNNEGSMHLSKSLGFVQINSPYDFFTLSKVRS